MTSAEPERAQTETISQAWFAILGRRRQVDPICDSCLLLASDSLEDFEQTRILIGIGLRLRLQQVLCR